MTITPVRPKKEPTCVYCAGNFAHPCWLYLLMDERHHPLKNPQTGVPYVGLSRVPLIRLKEQNREPGYKVGHKSTRKSAPHHMLAMVFGPFFGGAGRIAKKLWRSESRKIKSRLYRGMLRAKKWNRTLYVADKEMMKTVWEKSSA